MLSASILVPVLAIVLESVTYPGLISKHLGISLFSICVVGVIGVIATLWHKPHQAKATAEKPLRHWAPLLAGSYIASSFLLLTLYWIEATHFPNYIFSVLHIHLVILRWLPFFLGIILIFAEVRSLSWWTVFSLPLFIMLGLGVSRFAFPTFFLLIGEGGNIIRILKFLVLLVTFLLLSALLSQRHQLKLQGWQLVFLSCMALFVFFLLGEEIAWGERIFHFATLPFFAHNNIQHEDTIHNLRPIQDGILFKMYIVVGAAGSFGWILKAVLSQVKNSFISALRSFIPELGISSYYFPVLIYGLERVFLGPLKLKTWEESSELICYVGFFLVAYAIYKQSSQRFSFAFPKRFFSLS